MGVWRSLLRRGLARDAMPVIRGYRNIYDRLVLVARKSLKQLSFADYTVHIFLLDGTEMKKLEERAGLQKQKNHVPNVLSFPEPAGFPHPETEVKLLGEVYLNKDLASEGFEELAYLLIHGILHLLGYSHDKKNDILLMEETEWKICEKIFNNAQIKNFRKCHQTSLRD